MEEVREILCVTIMPAIGEMARLIYLSTTFVENGLTIDEYYGELNNQREKRTLIREKWVEMIRGVLRCFYLLRVKPEELVESKVKYTRKKYSGSIIDDNSEGIKRIGMIFDANECIVDETMPTSYSEMIHDLKMREGVILDAVLDCVEERGWKGFEQPRNLVMACFNEVGELVQLFQWKVKKLGGDESLIMNRDSRLEAAFELTDVLVYSLRLGHI
jgi:hypothetical protein